jgi:hypothetical protein
MVIRKKKAVAQKELFLGRKNIGEAFVHHSPNLCLWVQVMYAKGMVKFYNSRVPLCILLSNNTIIILY